MNGIVGLWHLDEVVGTTGTGSVLDRSGNGNNGTPSNVTFGASGQIGSAVSFNGTSSYILNSNTVNIPYTTVSAWIKISAVPSSNAYIIGFSNGNGGGINDKILYVDTEGKIRFYVYDGSAKSTSEPTITIPLNTWTHVVGTANGTTAYAYMNGSLVGSVAAGNTYTSFNSANLMLGGYTNGGSSAFAYLSMYLDEAAIWNRPLGDGTNNGSSNEILELYRRGANRIKYQIQTCTTSSSCSSSPNWRGPDGTNQTYFSELNNNAIQSDGGDLSTSDSVQTALPTMTFSNFSGLTVPTNRYFQYRAIMESDDTGTGCNYGSGATWCSPELRQVVVGPTHYDSSAPSIINKVGVNYLTLTSLVETLGTGGCSNGTVYNLSPNGTTWYYWNGSAWATAGGTAATASSATTLASNLTTYATQVGAGMIYFKVFLQSSGTSSCVIDNLAIGGTQ